MYRYGNIVLTVSGSTGDFQCSCSGSVLTRRRKPSGRPSRRKTHSPTLCTAAPHVGQLRPFGQHFRSPCSGQHRTCATSAGSFSSFAGYLLRLPKDACSHHALLMSIVSSYKCLIVNNNWLKLALNMNLSLMKVVFGYANLTKTNPEKCR